MPTPTVSECAWHPQNFGVRQYQILVKIPPGVSPQEIVEEADRLNLITHGICADCRAILELQLQARRASNRFQRSAR